MSDTILRSMIHVDEWLTELTLAAKQTNTQDGATAAELGEAAGWSRETISKKLRHAIKAGLWEHVRVTRTMMNGTTRLTDGYRPKAAIPAPNCSRKKK